MAFIRHQNIKIIEKTLQWCKNGVLRILSRSISEPTAMRMQPVRVRVRP